MLGGKPAQIRGVARLSQPRERLCSIVRCFYNAIARELHQYRRGKLLASIASDSKPIAHYYETLSRLSDNARSVLKWIADIDVLQFSHRVDPIRAYTTGTESATTDPAMIAAAVDSVEDSTRWLLVRD